MPINNSTGMWGIPTGFGRKSMPTNSQIAQYWATVAEIRVKRKGFDNLDPFLRPIFIDWGEAECMGCRQYFPSEYEGTNQFYKTWDAARLYRCHLIPRALGGSHSPNNLVLLCSRCHKDSPDVQNTSYMLEWLNNRREFIRLETESAVREAVITYGNPHKPLDVLSMFHKIRLGKRRQQFEEWLYNFCSLHWDGDYGPKVKIATIVAGYYEYARSFLKMDV